VTADAVVFTLTFNVAAAPDWLTHSAKGG
jgi:hypothetical protein